ncbi:hypothetical protein BKA70DRAFT_1234741 [Coprinopsis sp. MPI-PUGE-AT-0042]|nr:hypothetical protein BKA70DRAFT_1234741 [Coprinopsis sp. MPI-PUGE-AT-0042]
MLMLDSYRACHGFNSSSGFGVAGLMNFSARKLLIASPFHFSLPPVFIPLPEPLRSNVYQSPALAMSQPIAFKPSLSTEQTAFLKDNFRDRWHALVDSDTTLNAERQLKDEAVEQAIGTADKSKPLNSAFDPLKGPRDWAYPRIHKTWAKLSPEVTAARQAVFKLMGESSAKERWIEDNHELIGVEMKRLTGTGITYRGAALKSKAIKELYTDEVREEIESRLSNTDEDIAFNQDLLPYMLAELADNLLSTKLLGSAFVKISTTVRNEGGSLVSKLAYVGYDSVTGSNITYNPTTDVKAAALAAWVSESAQSLQVMRPTSQFGILKNEVGMPLFPPVDVKAITSLEMDGLLTEFLAAIWDFSVSAIVPKPSLDIPAIEDRPSDFIDVKRFRLAASLSYAEDHIKTYSLVHYFVQCALANNHFHFRSGPEIHAALEQQAARIAEQDTAGAPVEFFQAQSQGPPPKPDHLSTSTSISSPNGSPKMLQNPGFDQFLLKPAFTANPTSDEQTSVNNSGSQEVTKAAGSSEGGPEHRLDVDPQPKVSEPSTVSGTGTDVVPGPKPLAQQVPNELQTTCSRKRKSVPRSNLAPDDDETRNTAPSAKRPRLPRAAAAAPSYVAPKARAPAKKATAPKTTAPIPSASAAKTRPKRN